MANSYEILLSIAGKLAPSLTQSTAAVSKAIGNVGKSAETASHGLDNIDRSSRMEGLKNSLTEIKLAFGTVGVMAAGYLKGAISGAVEAQKANSNIAATVKSTGMAAGMTAKQVEDMAAGFSKVSLFGGNAIKTGDAMLLTFTNIGKDVLPGATQAMLDMAQKMGTDPVAQATKLGKALNDPSKGLTALTKVGVVFTKQQEDQIKAMQKAGDVAGAQKLILAELNKEFGGQALAATQTYEGQMAMLSKTMGGIKTSIGLVLLPYLQTAMNKFQSVANVVSDFAKNNTKLIAGILTLTAVFGTLIGGAGLVQKILSILGPVATGLGTTIGGMMLPVAAVIAVIALLGVAYSKNFGGMKTIVDGFVNGSMKFLMGVFKEVKAWVITNLPTIKATFKVVFDDVVAVLKGVIAFLGPIFMPVFRNLHQWFVTNMPVIRATFEVAFNKVLEVAGVLWAYFQVNLLPIIMRLVNTVKANLPMIQDIFSNVFSIIGNVLNIAWTIIKKLWDVMVSLYDFVSPTFPTIGKIIKDAFDIVVSVVEGVVNIFIKLVDWITKAVDWLTTWNDKPAKSKNATVTISETTTGKKIGGNASGTDSWRGGLTWVGEKGPELINLVRGAQVIPNNKINGRGGIADYIGAGKSSSLAASENMTMRENGMSVSYSPVYHIGGGNLQEFKQAAGDAQREFEQRMAQWLNNQRRVSFSQ